MFSKSKIVLLFLFLFFIQLVLKAQQFNLKYSIEKRIEIILDIDGDGICELLTDSSEVYDLMTNTLKYSYPPGNIINDDDFVALMPKINYPHADFNGDGKRELIIETNDYPNKVIIYDVCNNNILHEFSNPSRSNSFKCLMDVDNDNVLEIVVYELYWMAGENYDHYRTLIYSTSIASSSNEINNSIKNNYKLYQNYPNPFNPSTTINYEINNSSNVKINIYDITGQLVRELVNEYKNSGNYSIIWNGKNNSGVFVASGTYFYQIVSGDFVQAKKMILLK